MYPRVLVRFASVLALVSVSLVTPAAAAAHTEFEVGEYHLTIGWLNEPTFVGLPNGVELRITNHEEEPMIDLAPDALVVVVSTADQETESLPLVPGFNVEEGFGTFGQYEAELLPTTPGDYTFHFTGSIHDQPVDLTVTSGEETFSPVRSSSELEFPVKVPTLADVATRLDRIDGRIEALASVDVSVEALTAAEAAADVARSAAESANKALLVGAIIGGAGVVLAIVALLVAMRAGRSGAGPA